MPRNGAGVYSLPSNSWGPAVAGTDIDPTDWNSTGADLANALSTSIASTGVTTITANLPMAGFKHTGVGAASARTQYGQVAQIQDSGYVYAAATDGGTDAYVATLSPAITAYVTGMAVRLKFNERNTTTAPTLALNGIASPKTITLNNGDALAVGDIDTDGVYWLVYDGTNFQLQSPSGSLNAYTSQTPTIAAGSGTFTSVAATVRSTQMGKTVFVRVAVVITTNGTAAGQIVLSNFTLPGPFGGGTSAVLMGMNVSTGLVVRGELGTAGTTIIITKYDATYSGGDGQTIILNGTYEAA